MVFLCTLLVSGVAVVLLWSSSVPRCWFQVSRSSCCGLPLYLVGFRCGGRPAVVFLCTLLVSGVAVVLLWSSSVPRCWFQVWRSSCCGLPLYLVVGFRCGGRPAVVFLCTSLLVSGVAVVLLWSSSVPCWFQVWRSSCCGLPLYLVGFRCGGRPAVVFLCTSLLVSGVAVVLLWSSSVPRCWFQVWRSSCCGLPLYLVVGFRCRGRPAVCPHLPRHPLSAASSAPLRDAHPDGAAEEWPPLAVHRRVPRQPDGSPQDEAARDRVPRRRRRRRRPVLGRGARDVLVPAAQVMHAQPVHMRTNALVYNTVFERALFCHEVY